MKGWIDEFDAYPESEWDDAAQKHRHKPNGKLFLDLTKIVGCTPYDDEWTDVLLPAGDTRAVMVPISQFIRLWKLRMAE